MGKIFILFFAVLTALFLKESSLKNNPLEYYFNRGIEIAEAGTDENVTGWAWSENIGWVSFNSRNCDADGDGTIEVSDNPPVGCQPAGTVIPSYGVNINSSGNFSGYAWSNNIGWIIFERIKVCDNDKTKTCTDASQCGGGACNFINPPNAPYNTGTGKIASYSTSNKQVTGWAYILALGDEGWLKLRKNTGDPVCPPSIPDYGVLVDTVNGGELKGWGWNGNDKNADNCPDYGYGIGWLSFNCEDTGTCASAEYHVQAPVPRGLAIVPPIEQYTSSTCDSCSCLKINWTVDPLSQQDNFDVFEAGLKINSYPLEPDIRTYNQPGLPAGSSRDYVVVARNIFGHASSSPVTGTTKAICSVSDSTISATGHCSSAENPAYISLSWQAPVSACTIDHYEVARCDCGDNSCEVSECPNTYSSAYVTLASGTCNNPSVDQCDDNTFTEANSHDYYRYSVRGYCPTGDVYSDWSEPTDSIQPCPKEPKWIERKSQ